MDVLELKFLLELLGFPDYRAPISKIKPNPQTKAAERDSICRNLCDRELVAYSCEVLQLSIAPPGKSLLKLDTTRLPIAESEVQVLKACADSSITPAQTGLSANSRQAIIQGLAERGLIKAEKTQINEVWLTQRGLEYLQDEYNPSGTAPVISLDMLTHYLRFLRKSLREKPAALPQNEQELPPHLPLKKEADSHPVTEEKQETLPAVVNQLSDADILQMIRDLDRELATENYLPIFQLRQKLQSQMSGQELNRTLYRLQRNDKIELSSLQEAIAYTPEQIEAGIPQDVGGPLFFIIVI
ncbi:MAG: hypothetical protein KME19_17395 [Microcoleus vaginatus WJT46-NPBG5]|jgi:hypothetical protein|nr:hypothetical protein [Microcoleus vaginatus WJT46-NPBG5]